MPFSAPGRSAGSWCDTSALTVHAREHSVYRKYCSIIVIFLWYSENIYNTKLIFSHFSSVFFEGNQIFTFNLGLLISTSRTFLFEKMISLQAYRAMTGLPLVRHKCQELYMRESIACKEKTAVLLWYSCDILKTLKTQSIYWNLLKALCLNLAKNEKK